MTTIIGAGLSGLIAAHMFPQATIIEAGEAPQEAHKALLRFRTDAVAKLTGIEFRKVVVRKGIWMNDGFVEPNIAIANLYAAKCLEGRVVGERSIWKLDPVERYIAPDDFYWRLISSLQGRIQWGTPYDFKSAIDSPCPVISTAPMPLALEALGIDPGIEFQQSAITVRRWLISDCDVHQTVYFPGHDTTLYRASITGNMLICEFIGQPDGDWQRQVFGAFGISPTRWKTPAGKVSQKYGKIAPIDDNVRMALICKLTAEHNILSLGRFAVWRNILLDDVVNDAATVKRLINMLPYERKLKAAKGA